MYIYRLTLEVNNKQKFYIGKCSTGDPNYFGSGKILKYFYRKYGIDIVKEKTILFETNDIEELNLAEIRFISIFNAVADKNYLNIARGGEGGNTYKGLSKLRIKRAMQKRQEFYKKHPHVLQQRIQKFKATISIPTIKQRILSNQKRSMYKRIENYRLSRKNNSAEKKAVISQNLSIAQKAAYLKKTPEQKMIKKQKEMLTKQCRTTEQRERESALKSEASKRAAIERALNPDKMLEYSKKLSAGVKRWRNSLTEDQKKEIKFKRRFESYKRNGMMVFEHEVRNMIDNKTSLEIYHFLQDKNISTHHVCVQRFIDFLKTYPTI